MIVKRSFQRKRLLFSSLFLLASQTFSSLNFVLAAEDTTVEEQSCTASKDIEVCEAPIDCDTKVENGECNSNPYLMLKHCMTECLDDGDLATIGYFQESDVISEGDSIGCFDTRLSEDEEDATCEDLAMNGDCVNNPGFMLFYCANSCMVCYEPGTKTFPIGDPQEIHPDDIDNPEIIQKTIDIILKTFTYMSTQIMNQQSSIPFRSLCRNNDEFCSSLAATNLCIKPENYDELPDDDPERETYEYMMSECAPACQSCETSLIDLEVAKIMSDCIPDTRHGNIFGPGDLNRMFERIVGELEFGEDKIVPDYKANIHSRPTHPPGFKGNDDDPTEYVLGPWVVTLENILTDEECDRLVQLGGSRGYIRSELEEEKDYDEEQLRIEKETEDAYRTSTNTWCEEECWRDPVTQRVLQKISNVTGVPDSFSEYLQLLSYVPGQYYKEHHDYVEDQPYQNPGPRMITFFLYLNDVTEGGSTRLTDITGDDGGIFLDIQPKKGMALLWPSVLDEDPSAMDDRTYHEALAVLKGRKYGANAWLHLRQYKSDPCDYDALNEIGLEENDEGDFEEEENEIVENDE